MKSISHVIEGKLKTYRLIFFASIFFHFRFLDLERFDLDIFIYDLKCSKKQCIML